MNASKLIPVTVAKEMLSHLANETGLGAQDKTFLLRWLESFPAQTSKDGVPCVNQENLLFGFQNLSDYLDQRDPSALLQERGWLPGKTVDVIEFVESREYVGGLVKVWPGVKDNLHQIWHNSPKPFEIVLTGSIRSGKSMTAQLSTEYLLYLLSRLRDPHARFGLSKGRTLVIVLQSVTQGKAERVLLGPMRSDIDTSPYFQRHYPRNRDINNKIIMPDGIEVVPVTTNDTSAFGENVFSAVITEANAMPVIKNSVKLRYSNKTEYDQARELYNRIRERITATFNVNDDTFFGRLIVDSSVENPEDFTHQKMQEAKTDPSILVIHKAIWEVQPPSKFPPDEPRFPVEIGDTHRSSRVLDAPDEALNPEAVKWIPMQLKKYFVADVETALKNFAGIVTSVSGAFLPFKEKINEAQSGFAALSGGRQIFKHPEISFLETFGRLSPGESPDWGEVIDYDYIKESVSDPNVPFSIRIDLSATGDATGLAVARISGYVDVAESTTFNPRTARYEHESNVRAPVYQVDGLLRIVARHGEEIDPNLVAALGVELNRHINIKWGTSDRAESSRAVLITWRTHEIFCDFLSVDTDLRPFIEIKNALREGRIFFPPHETADRELKQLRKISRNQRAYIDHPDTVGASKDVADAMAGACFVLQVKEAIQQLQKHVGRPSRQSRQNVAAAGGHHISKREFRQQRGERSRKMLSIVKH